MPKPIKQAIHREEIIAALSQMVHDDFASEHDGTGSAFCPGCVAMRSVHALLDVYEDIEVEDIASQIVDTYKGGDLDIENVVTIH